MLLLKEILMMNISEFAFLLSNSAFLVSSSRGQAPSAPSFEPNPQHEVFLLANTSQLGTGK